MVVCGCVVPAHAGWALCTGQQRGLHPGSYGRDWHSMEAPSPVRPLGHSARQVRVRKACSLLHGQTMFTLANAITCAPLMQQLNRHGTEDSASRLAITCHESCIRASSPDA